MGSRSWQAGLTAAQFEALRADPRLPRLLALARVANALSLAHHGLMMSLKWQNPRSVKERTSAILYAAAVLFEGLKVAESLPKHFRDLPQYKEGLGTILADPEVAKLRTRFLKPLRDQAVFHFDRSIFEHALKKMEVDDDLIVISGEAPNAAGIYFNLADDITSYHLVDEYADSGKFLLELESFMIGTTNLFKRFTIASQRLLGAAFRELGVRRLKPRKQS